MIAGRVCRQCRCTDDLPCVIDPETGELVDIDDGTLAYDPRYAGLTVCYWVQPDLCSGCVAHPPPPLLYDGQGRPLRGAP